MSFCLQSHCLIALPGTLDGQFDHSVIYLCSHTDEGAMGIMVNRELDDMLLSDLLARLDISVEETEELDKTHPANTPLIDGGPVEQSRGFVLHSDDYFAGDDSLAIGNGIAMTSTTGILRALARDEGPKQALVALGYCGWGPGQLEQEIADNSWLSNKTDPSFIFEAENRGKYDVALGTLGIRAENLMTGFGHA